MPRNLDLLVVSVSAILAVLIALSFGSIEIALVALPLVLFLPGYALDAMLLPAREHLLEETVLHSVGLSLASVVLLGLFLNFTPWGLSPLSWAVALPSLTLVSCMAAAILRGRTPQPVRVAPARHSTLGLGFGSGIWIGLTMITLVAVIAVTRLSLAAQPTPEFAQLWMQPAAPQEQNQYDLGVRNAGSSPAVFRLEAIAGDTLIYQFSNIALAPGETWERHVQIPSAGAAMVQARLYQRDSDQVYRQVDIWTNGQ